MTGEDEGVYIQKSPPTIVWGRLKGKSVRDLFQKLNIS